MAKTHDRAYIGGCPSRASRIPDMAKLQSLETFSLHETENGYRLLVSAVGGDALYVEITPAQMDDIIESLEAAMGGEDEDVAEDDEGF
jgi:hypothetical protein